MNQNQPRNNYSGSNRNDGQNRFAPSQQTQSNRNFENFNGNRENDVCHFCKQPGHYKNKCFKLQAKIEQEQYLQSTFGYQTNGHTQSRYQPSQNSFGNNQNQTQQNTHGNTYNASQNTPRYNPNNTFVQQSGPSGN